MKKVRLSFFMVTLVILVLVASSSADQVYSNSGNGEDHKGLQLGSLHSSPHPNSSNGSDVSGTQTVTLYNIPLESGQVYSNRSVSSKLIVGSISNIRSQALLSFNISSIPKGSIIRNAVIDFRQSEVLGDPFLNLGCLKVYQATYGKIDPGCYYRGFSYEGIIKICSFSDFSTPKSYDGLLNALQDSVGASRFQLRMQFDEKGAGLSTNDFAFWGKDTSPKGSTWEDSIKLVCGDNPFKDNPSTGKPPSSIINNAIRSNTVGLQITFSPPNGDASSSAGTTSNAQLSNKTSDSNDVIGQLERLTKLKDQGVLSEEEFQAQKKKILNT